LIPGVCIPKIVTVLLQTPGYLAPPSNAKQIRDRLIDTVAFLAALLAEPIPISHDNHPDHSQYEGVSAPHRSISTTSSSTTTTAFTVQDLIGWDGWKATLQVRFVHARVRRRILQSHHARTSSSSSTVRWDVQQWGFPINAEDMAATLLAFSFVAMQGCEVILGNSLNPQERLDYLHFWRLVGWLLGVETTSNNSTSSASTTNLTPSTASGNRPKSLPLAKPPPTCLEPCGRGWNSDPWKHATVLLFSILLHLLHPDDRSRRIAHHMLSFGEVDIMQEKGRQQQQQQPEEEISEKNTIQPVTCQSMWYYYRSLQCRRLVGDELADALHLPYHPHRRKRWQLWMYSTTFLWILRLYTWASRPRSPVRKYILRFHHHHQFQKFWNNWNDRKQTSMRTGNNSTSSCPFAMESTI
jgi:hypothetical protein